MAFGKMFTVGSEAVEFVQHDPETCTLRVGFRASPKQFVGAVYDYLDVPHTVVGKMFGSPSVGAFINKVIKKTYTVRKVADAVMKPEGATKS